MSTTTTTAAPQTFDCDCCGAETPRDLAGREITDAARDRPICLDCEGRHIAADGWAAEAAYELLLATARRALAGYLSPEDAAAAIAEAASEMETVKMQTRADLLHSERRNRERRAARLEVK